jgi:sialic acid synthase SpsE
MIILDFGSGNTCKNSIDYVKRMIDELKKIDNGKHEVIIKWQLFEQAGANIPLEMPVFDYAYKYAKEKGYSTAASVFDLNSLWYLLHYDVPFVKLANNKSVYELAGEIPRKLHIIKSVSKPDELSLPEHNTTKLACVSEYPAPTEKYIKVFGHRLSRISDHTTDFLLWNRFKPSIIEWHYKLSDSTGLDAGQFARTPEQLKGIL